MSSATFSLGKHEASHMQNVLEIDELTMITDRNSDLEKLMENKV